MKQRPRVVYIISRIDKSLGFEWIARGLKDDYHLTFVLLNQAGSHLEDFLTENEVDVKRILYRGKKDFVQALFKLIYFLISERPAVVHAHLWEAQLLGLPAAWLTRIRKRIYTRHASNFHHVYFPRSVWMDRLCNWLATDIVSISQATDRVLLDLESVPRNKIVKIPHGFEWEAFTGVSAERIQHIRSKWAISQSNAVIGVIARHIEWKGVAFIVEGFKEFLKDYPGAILILANASGPEHMKIRSMLEGIPPNQFVIIPFEEDIGGLYQTFDFYVHVPVDSLSEAFGQTYIEALAAGIPSVFTLSGVAAEFIVDQKNALVVEFKNAHAIYRALDSLYKNKELRQVLAQNGRRDVISRFGISQMLFSLKQLYDR